MNNQGAICDYRNRINDLTESAELDGNKPDWPSKTKVVSSPIHVEYSATAVLDTEMA